MMESTKTDKLMHQTTERKKSVESETDMIVMEADREGSGARLETTVFDN